MIGNSYSWVSESSDSIQSVTLFYEEDKAPFAMIYGSPRGRCYVEWLRCGACMSIAFPDYTEAAEFLRYHPTITREEIVQVYKDRKHVE